MQRMHGGGTMLSRAITIDTMLPSGRRVLRRCPPGSRGYTLVETVISLVLLTAVIVPLSGRFFKSTALSDARVELVGVRLIEREAALARTFPEEVIPIKRRVVDGDEWTLRTSVSETGPLLYTITAELRGSVKAQAVFYGRADNDTR